MFYSNEFVLTWLIIFYSGGLPWFLEKTHFKGRVFMTHPTKAIYRYVCIHALLFACTLFLPVYAFMLYSVLAMYMLESKTEISQT